MLIANDIDFSVNQISNDIIKMTNRFSYWRKSEREIETFAAATFQNDQKLIYGFHFLIVKVN